MIDSAQPPAHVVAAFGADAATPQRLPGLSGGVWRYGDAVLRVAADPVEAAWASGVFESLRVAEVRVARPLRSLDGRWVVGGWRAERYLSGRPAARYTDIIDVAFDMDKALAGFAVPRFVLERDDVYGWSDRVSWDGRADLGGRLGSSPAAQSWFAIAAGRRPVDDAAQLVHGDMFGNVLFAGSAPPAVIGFRPLGRPAGFSAALVVVDAVAWGGAPVELADRGHAVPHWADLVRYACLERLALALVHPRTASAVCSAVASAAERLIEHVSA